MQLRVPCMTRLSVAAARYAMLTATIALRGWAGMPSHLSKTIQARLQMVPVDSELIVGVLRSCPGVSVTSMVFDPLVVIAFLRVLFTGVEQHVLCEVCQAWQVVWILHTTCLHLQSVNPLYHSTE